MNCAAAHELTARAVVNCLCRGIGGEEVFAPCVAKTAPNKKAYLAGTLYFVCRYLDSVVTSVTSPA